MEKSKLKVAIVTLHRIFNYGSVSQTYATYKMFENLGYDVEVVDYITEQRRDKRLFFDIPEHQNKNVIYNCIYLALRSIFIIANKCIFGGFLKKYVKLTSKKYISPSDLDKHPPVADIYVAGSDQIWNSKYNEGIDRGFFLEFVESDNKIAFASSFGKKELSGVEEEKVKGYLEKFKAISVREKHAVDIIEKMGINSLCILDPTLQLKKEEWMKLASKRLIKEKYLLLFLLYGEDNGATEYARKLADKKGLILVKLSWDKKKHPLVDKLMTYRKTEDFYSLFQYADFVITNSFHGLAFSINFNKQFLVFQRNEFNSRLESLLEIAGLSNRMIRDGNSTLNFSKIDYKGVNKILDSERNKAKDFLENALKDIN